MNKYTKNKRKKLFFKDKVVARDVWKWLDQLSSLLIPKHNPINLYRIFEFKLALALFLDDKYLMDRVKKEIDAEIRMCCIFKSYFQNPPMNGVQNCMQSLTIGILWEQFIEIFK